MYAGVGISHVYPRFRHTDSWRTLDKTQNAIPCLSYRLRMTVPFITRHLTGLSLNFWMHLCMKLLKETLILTCCCSICKMGPCSLVLRDNTSYKPYKNIMSKVMKFSMSNQSLSVFSDQQSLLDLTFSQCD